MIAKGEKNKIWKKILAVYIVFTMIFGNISFLGIGLFSTYAMAPKDLQTQNATTNNANVEFDAYFLDSNKVKNHSSTLNSKSQENVMYLSLGVLNAGYLKNAKIYMQDESGNSTTNFTMQQILDNQQVVQSTDTQNQTITLKQIDNGTQAQIGVPVSLTINEKMKVQDLNKNNKIVLEGTYVDEKGKEIKIKKEIYLNIKWNTDSTLQASANVQKYIPYNTKTESGTIIQTNVTVNLENKNSQNKMNSLPIKQTSLVVKVPTLNGNMPKYINVIAKSTQATNGKTGKDSIFTKDNWKYDATTNTIQITVDNSIENGEIWTSYGENAQDEYLILCAYATDATIAQGTTIPVEVTATAKTYQDSTNEGTIQKKLAGNATLPAKTTDIVEYGIQKNIDAISKGYLYANYTASASNETEFIEKWTAQIEFAKAIDSIQIATVEDKFIDNNNVENTTNISNKNLIYYQQTILNKANLVTVLGEEGSITIEKETGEKITTINLKEATTDESGNIIVDYTNFNKTVSKIVIKTSKPTTEGSIEINNKKAIKADTTYSLDQLKTFKKLQIANEVKVKYADMEGYVFVTQTNAKDTITLNETYSKAEIQISSENLSTVVKNENVEIRVILRADKIEYDLYKNPIMDIELPKSIKEITFKDLSVLFSDELKIKEAFTYVNESGNTVIRIALEGNQTKYAIGEMGKGITIVMNTDITLDPLALSAEENMKLTYSNEKAIGYENGTNTILHKLNVVGPNEIITTTEVTNYRDSETVQTMEEEKVGNLEIYTGNKTATVQQKIINNLPNDIENVSVLGRLPVTGAKQIDSNQELANTFNATLKGAITVTGIDASNIVVLYSENGSATKDLNNTANGWTTQVTDYSKIKSYLVFINNTQIAKGTLLEINYQLDIPANLSHNNSVFGIYKVYYQNKSAIGMVPETKVSPLVGLSTGAGPELEVSVKSDLAASTQVREGQVVKFYATVKNTGKVTAQDVNLVITAPQGTLHTSCEGGLNTYADSKEKDKTITIGTLAAGESVTKEYELRMSKIDLGLICKDTTHFSEEGIHFAEELHQASDYVLTIDNTAKITAKDLDKALESAKYSIVSTKGYVQTEQQSDKTTTTILKNGDILTYRAYIKNTSGEDLKNVIATQNIPEGTTLKEAYFEVNGTRTDVTVGNANTATFNIPTISATDIVFTYLVVTANNLDKQVMTQTKVTADNVYEHISNIVTNKISVVTLTISQQPGAKEYVKEKEEFSYQFTITNTSDIAANNVIIEDILPEYVEYVKTIFKVGQGKETQTSSAKDNTVKLTLNIPAKTTATVTIKVKAGFLPNKEEKEVSNVATLAADGFNQIQSNTVKNVIEYYEGAHVDDSGNPIEPPVQKGRYKITGTAWVDSNKDGKMDDLEERLSNVAVILLNKANGNIVEDIDNKQLKTVTTAQNGNYEFTNLPVGEYLVAFLYDSGTYELTEYKKSGVSEVINSDAIAMKINYNGKEQNGAITDTLKVVDSNIRNINIGLVSGDKFDLKLDKYISKVTVSNSKGVKSYEAKNAKLAKVEIYRKDITASTVAIEYKIVISNQGNVAGYAKKIVDYVAKGMKFSSELNKDWYLADNGNIYNSTLADTKLNPGESKEVTLVLTKTMTDSNTGLVNNNAEIYEDYNERGLKDSNSTAGNKVQGENDMSSADALITAETGSPIVYTGLILTGIAVLGLGIYFIKKKVLDKKV